MTLDYTLTFGSSAVQLSSLILPGQETTCRAILLQADPGNSGLIYVGGSNHGAAVGSSSYGFSIPIPVTNVPAAPIQIELAQQSIELADFWVKGTSSDKLHVFLKL